MAIGIDAFETELGELEIKYIKQYISNNITAASILCGFGVTLLTLIITTIFTEKLPNSIYIEIWFIIILLSICSFLICIEFYLSASKRIDPNNIRKLAIYGDILYNIGFFSLISAVFLVLYALYYLLALLIGVLIFISLILFHLVITKRNRDSKKRNLSQSNL